VGATVDAPLLALALASADALEVAPTEPLLVMLLAVARPAFRSLNQQFFESYLKALLCTGRFDKVCEQQCCCVLLQHARMKLCKRFAKSAPIAVALREAKAQQA
jgi:hypothetical protein